MLSIAHGVWSSPWSKLDQHLPILRLISGVFGRKSVTYLDYLYCRAEEWFARGRYLIKFRSYGVTNVQGRGRNELTLLEIFLGHFIELIFWIIFAKDHGHFFFLFLSLFFSSSFFSFFLSLFFTPLLNIKTNQHKKMSLHRLQITNLRDKYGTLKRNFGTRLGPLER